MAQMIRMYGRDQHHAWEGLCPGCNALLDYTRERLDKCSYQSEKTRAPDARSIATSPRLGGKVRESFFPFFVMEVGDSFFVSLSGKTHEQVQADNNHSIRYHRKKGTFSDTNKFATRTVEEGGVKGVRRWRIQ
jgi:hypothetical protein